MAAADEKSTGKGDAGGSGGSSEAAGSGSKLLAADRPAETVTALGGVVGAAAAQLLDLENAAVVSLLLAVVGLLPALVTWLVEVGKKWDDSPSSGSAAGAAAELDYLQARMLREVGVCVGPDFDARVEKISQVRQAFSASQAPQPQAESDKSATATKVEPKTVSRKGAG